jgi:hypothetical protein
MALLGQRKASSIGGLNRPEYFSPADAGSTTPNVASSARGGVWAIKSITQRVTEKSGLIRAIVLVCIVPPKCADGTSPRSLASGAERTLFAKVSNQIQWDQAGQGILFAAGVPLAPELRVQAIDRVHALTGKYPPGFAPGALDADNPEHTEALNGVLDLAVNLLEPFASEGEGRNLACASHDDGTGLIVINSTYEGDTYWDKEAKKRFPKLTNGIQEYHANHRPAALSQAQVDAVIEVIVEGKLPPAALEALGPKFVARAKAAYADAPA